MPSGKPPGSLAATSPMRWSAPRFLKLDCSHIEFVMECLRNNTTEIRNMKQYLLAVLFNAPTTISNHYTAQVNHDMYAGGW